jgi:carboxymethylenebutenolidase
VSPVPGAVSDPSSLADRDVTFSGAGGDAVGGYLVEPRGSDPRPGLLVLHEAMGLNDHIRDVARRFANIGFSALAPDLYAREGSPGTDVGAFMKAMLAVPDERAVADLDGAAAFLRDLETANGKVGCIGFCSGGRQTLLFACSSSAPDVAVDCWGGFTLYASPDDVTTPTRPVPVADLIPGLACPLMIAVGAEDTNPSPADADLLRERLWTAGKDFRIEVFEEAGHAFFADYRPSYQEEAAKRLWHEVVPYLRDHLD